MFYGERDNDELLLHSGFVLDGGGEGQVKDAATATVELDSIGERLGLGFAKKTISNAFLNTFSSAARFARRSLAL